MVSGVYHYGRARRSRSTPSSASRPGSTGTRSRMRPRDRRQLAVALGVLRIAAAIEADRRADDPVLQVEAEELAALRVAAEHEAVPARREARRTRSRARTDPTRTNACSRRARSRPASPGPRPAPAGSRCSSARRAGGRRAGAGGSPRRPPRRRRAATSGSARPRARRCRPPPPPRPAARVGHDADAGHHQVALAGPAPSSCARARPGPRLRRPPRNLPGPAPRPSRDGCRPAPAPTSGPRTRASGTRRALDGGDLDARSGGARPAPRSR